MPKMQSPATLTGTRQPPPAVLPCSTTPRFNAYVEHFFDMPWLDRAIQDLRDASSIVLSTTDYSDNKLHDALLAALRRRCPVQILVDAQALEEGKCRGMKTKLVELKKAQPMSAEVFVWRDEDAKRGKQEFGPNGLPGIMHAKVICIDDGRIVWHGGANATRSSRKNVECMTKEQGPSTQVFVMGLRKVAESAEPM